MLRADPSFDIDGIDQYLSVHSIGIRCNEEYHRHSTIRPSVKRQGSKGDTLSVHFKEGLG